MNTVIFTLLLSITASIGVMQAYGQNGPVAWSIKPGAKAAAEKPDAVPLQITATVAEGWHIYALTKVKTGPIPTSINPGEGYALVGGVQAPKPATKFDTSFQMTVGTYTGTVVFGLTLKPISASTMNGPAIFIRYQACNGQTCLLPKTVELRP